MEKALIPERLTSVTFDCYGGLQYKEKQIGRQQTSILLSQKKVIQRFYSFWINGYKPITTFEYKISKELADELAVLLKQIDIFSWTSSDDFATGPDSEWDMTIRAGGVRKIRGGEWTPKGGKRIEKLLNQNIEFKYPLMLFSPHDISLKEEANLSEFIRPYIIEREEKFRRRALDRTHEFLQVFMQTPLAKVNGITEDSEEVAFIGSFWSFLFYIHSDPCWWTDDTAYKLGYEFFPVLVQKFPALLENFGDLINISIKFFSSQRMMNQRVADYFLDNILEGAQAYSDQVLGTSEQGAAVPDKKKIRKKMNQLHGKKRKRKKKR